jgi:hypothetical protein
MGGSRPPMEEAQKNKGPVETPGLFFFRFAVA